MTKCTKCGSCQIVKDETGQNAIFCEACGGAVEVVSDELPFVYTSVIVELSIGGGDTIYHTTSSGVDNIDLSSVPVSLTSLSKKS